MQAETQTVTQFQDESKKFLWGEKKENKHINRRKEFNKLGYSCVNKLGYSVVIHGWLLTLPSIIISIFNSSCGQNACIPNRFENSCLEDNFKLAQLKRMV